MADDIEVPGLKFLGDSNVTIEPAPESFKSMPTPAKTKAAPDVADLQPDLLDRVTKLKDLWKNSKEFNPKGEELPITSGYRTIEQQREEYKNRLKNPNLVAEPGKSRHEKGDAIDIHPRVPNSLLAQVGLHRPLGSKDPVHVQINPDIAWQPAGEKTEEDITIPGMKLIDENIMKQQEETRNQPWYKTFAKQTASLGDVALGSAPAAVQFVGEPVAKLVDRVGNTKIAEEALSKVTNYFDKPIAKAFGITNDPAYNAEAAHKIMDFAGEHVDNGAQWVADKTGMDKSDAKWFINAALLKAAPTAGRAIKGTGKAIHENVTAENVGNLLSEVSGKLTSTSPYNTKRGFAAGYEKNPTILEASKEGAVSAPEIVNNVREAFSNVKENRRQAYQQGIASTKGNQVFLDFKPIRQEFDKMVDSLKSKNLGAEESKVGEKTMAKVNEIKAILDTWESKPELHTAGNLDDLKQRIDDTYEQGMTDQAKRVMTNTRNKVKETIANQDPNYEKTMADYEKGLALEREIKQALGLGDKAAVDTTIRKLAQIFSNKSSLSKEYRLELLQELEKVGGKGAIDKLIGYAMGQSTPSGMQLLADFGIGAMAHFAGNPEAGMTTLAGLTAAQSPKLALYTSYGAGRAARAASDIGKAAKAQVAKGKTKLSEITARK